MEQSRHLALPTLLLSPWPPTQQPLQMGSRRAPAEPQRLGRLWGLPPRIMRLLMAEPEAPARHNRALSAGPAPTPAQSQAQYWAPCFPRKLRACPGASQDKPCLGCAEGQSREPPFPVNHRLGKGHGLGNTPTWQYSLPLGQGLGIPTQLWGNRNKEVVHAMPPLPSEDHV